MNPASYLAEIHSKFVSSPVILDSHIVSERLTQDDVAPARRMNTCQLIDAIERELNM